MSASLYFPVSLRDTKKMLEREIPWVETPRLISVTTTR